MMISLPATDHLLHSTAFQSALVALTLAFYLASPHFPTVKQRSWILTTISSAVMTIASLPLAYDYFSSYADITRIPQSSMWTYCACRFFQAYLIADIVLGLLHYRSKVNWLTGWVHHSIYVLVVEYAVRMNWSHIFCLCAIMEIPTFVLAIAALNPNLRSDVLFATTFFLTRIALHVRLGLSFFLQRARVTEGSMGPGILMACIFPLHAFWFSGCVKGFVKRNQQGKKKKRVADGNGAVVARRGGSHPIIFSIVSLPQTAVLTRTPEHPSIPHTSSFTSPSPRPSTFSRRRVALRLAMRQRWDQFRLSRAGRHFGEMQRRLRDVLPMRELVYDYVGIERGDMAGEIVRKVGVFNIFGCPSRQLDLDVRRLVVIIVIIMNSPNVFPWFLISDLIPPGLVTYCVAFTNALGYACFLSLWIPLPPTVHAYLLLAVLQEPHFGLHR
ncbi:hypothetical protein EDD17DRAFT_1572703 [Pisolithus thermaeus]|nr:hypothetical protein EDD17DRAFT_1572703 [Pisolithus thermaeus]